MKPGNSDYFISEFVLILCPGQEERRDGGREEQEARVKQHRPVVSDMREQSEKDGAKGCDDAPNIIGKPRACRPQQGREQRRQVHCEQRKSSLAQAD